MPSTDQPGSIVGTLAQWHPESKKTSNRFTLYSNAEVYVGRDKKRCQYTIEDPFISNTHIRIYTIIFDQENPEDVAPLVYAQDMSMNGTTWNGYPMGKGRGSFLLSDGDILTLSSDVHLMFCSDDCMEEEDFDMVQQIEMEALGSQYAITQRKLGSGAYGQVYMAYKKETGQQFACKVVDFRRVRNRAIDEQRGRRSSFFAEQSSSSTDNSWSEVVAIRERRRYLSKKIREKLDVYNREATILERLCHPNIISVEKVVKSRNTIYLFQELITAGDLFSFIQYKGGRLSDIEAAVIIRQVLLAVQYLHARDIVHRDLKPDNILMTSLADGGRVVLTDFGCARLDDPTVQRMSTMVGTFEYSAPEVLRSNRQGYTKAVDLWSLGCVTVALLMGYPPFGDPLNDGYSGGQARECDLARLDEELDWNKTGHRAKDFISRLLVLDETKRMDIKQALRHDWFTNPAHRQDFEALYKRSIRDWQPRVHKGPLIVDFCSFTGSKSEVPSQVSEHVPSIEPPSELYPEASGDLGQKPKLSNTKPDVLLLRSSQWRPHTCREISPTLSDPVLPPHKGVNSGLVTATGQCSLLSPHAAQDTMDCDVNTTGLLSRVQFLSSSEPSMHTTQYSDPPVVEAGDQEIHANMEAISSRISGIAQPRVEPTKGSTEGPDVQSQNGRTRWKCIWDDSEGEVYEAVDNTVTGRSEYFIYGASYQ